MMDSAASSSAQRLTIIGDSAGKERDKETGLDYFGARYYSGAQGRFASPDPILHPNQSKDPFHRFSSQPDRWNKKKK